MIEGFCSIFLWSGILTRNELRKWHGIWPTSPKGWWFWPEKLHSIESLGMSIRMSMFKWICPNRQSRFLILIVQLKKHVETRLNPNRTMSKWTVYGAYKF